jgi:uncharacterized metal-binding protein YceD (DUF177 family)
MTDNEFSRVVRVEPLPRDGIEMDIEADATEREKLAALNGLPAIAHFSASFRIKKWMRGVEVEGELSARVTQTCVVSLEPFEIDIEEPIDVRFLPGAPADSIEEDAPDPLVDGRIDLGAIASEFLTLSLDPYPRKPGVAFEPPTEADAPDSAFARLRALAARDEPD